MDEEKVVEALDEAGGGADPRAFKTIVFSTAEPFRIKGAGCGWHWEYNPITPEGVRYTPEQAASCHAEQQNLTLGFSATPKDWPSMGLAGRRAWAASTTVGSTSRLAARAPETRPAAPPRNPTLRSRRQCCSGGGQSRSPGADRARWRNSAAATPVDRQR